MSAMFNASLALIWGVNTLFLMDAGLDIFQVMLVNARVQQAEMRTQEALLRLECRIAEMADNRAKPS